MCLRFFKYQNEGTELSFQANSLLQGLIHQVDRDLWLPDLGCFDSICGGDDYIRIVARCALYNFNRFLLPTKEGFQRGDKRDSCINFDKCFKSLDCIILFLIFKKQEYDVVEDEANNKSEEELTAKDKEEEKQTPKSKKKAKKDN